MLHEASHEVHVILKMRAVSCSTYARFQTAKTIEVVLTDELNHLAVSFAGGPRRNLLLALLPFGVMVGSLVLCLYCVWHSCIGSASIIDSISSST